MKLTRTELSDKLNITAGQWRNRHDDLLDYLNDFMSIVEIKEGRYYYYEVDELPEEIPPLPRKNQTKEKIVDYEQFTKNTLTVEFQPTSQTKIAREAIKDFGKKKYNHTNSKTIGVRYVKPALNKYGVHSERRVWVNSRDYHRITEEQEEFLHSCFRSVDFDDQQRLSAFDEHLRNNTEITSEERGKWNTAITSFQEKYAFTPISVFEWRVKGED